ncbi:MAG: SulP family inorganic anion transporter, partial [Halanaerobiaceae bacterium]
FIGQGIINIICPFFNSFAITGSFTNSFANYDAGARTRISQLITGVSILLTVVVLRPLVEFVPITALAGIVIYVAYTMFNREEFLQVIKTTNFDAIVLFSTLITTIIAPRLDYAVFFGIFVSFLLVLRNTSDINYSHMEYLHRDDDDFALQNIEDVQDDQYIIINLSGILHFNSAQNLKRNLKDSFRENKIYVIRMRDVDDIDHTSLQELERFISRVNATGGEVIICGVEPRIYDRLEKYGIIDKVQKENVFCGSEHIFSSTKDAIEKARRRS